MACFGSGSLVTKLIVRRALAKLKMMYGSDHFFPCLVVIMNMAICKWEVDATSGAPLAFKTW